MQKRVEKRYLIKLNDEMAEFFWSATPENPTKGSTDLKIKVKEKELIHLAEILGCTKERDIISVPNLDVYNKLLLYSSVRASIRSPNKAKELAELILDLKGWDAHYWASKFREFWWRYRRPNRLRKMAKAFKLLFGLE